MLGCLLAYASVSNGQTDYVWKQIGDLSTTMHFAYFFDATHGVVAGLNAIWVYKNGLWDSPSSIPLGEVSFFTSVNELQPGVLYATSGDTDVWVSRDSGTTWQNTSTPGAFALDAYFTKDGVLHTTYAGTFVRLDSNICLLTNNNGAVPSYSTNGGATWTPSATGYNIGGLCAYADTCRHMFYATSKDSTAFYSDDSGRTWHPTGPKLSEDILNGADGSVYHQDTSGVWCSVDAGTSWRFLGGPKATSGDYSMCGFGIEGKWIVAMTGGQVWLYAHVDSLQPVDPITRVDTTENCPISRIPVTVRAFTRPFQITMRISTVGPQTVSPRDTSFTIQPGAPITLWYTVSPTISQRSTYVTLDTRATDGCRSFEWIDTFTIVTVPLPIATPDLQMQNCVLSDIPLNIHSQNPLRMYVAISADSGWSVQPADTTIHLAANTEGSILLKPDAPSLPIGTLIHIHASDTVACTIYVWDTAFTVSIVPVPIPWTWVDSVAINACDSVRIPITLDLASCDSLSMDSLSVSPSNGLLNFESNPNLGRGKIDTLWLVYAPHGRNDSTHYQLIVRSHFVPEGTPLDTIRRFLAVSSGSPDPSASAPKLFALNTCDEAPLTLFVKAPGCENVRIDSIRFSDAGLMMSGGPAAADTVFGGETDTVRYTVEALYPGDRILSIYYYLYRLSNQETFDTAISITLDAPGAEAEPMISTEPRLNLSNCSISTVPIVFHAPCDSITITSCNLTVPNGLNYTSNLTFPLKLGAEATDSLLLSFPTQGLNQMVTILAEIKGTYGGSTTTFDTTAQTLITFACAGVAPEVQPGEPMVLTGIQATSDQLQFAITKDDETITGCQAEIVSILGDMVAQRTFSLPSTANALSWNLNGLPSGTYYLRIVSGKNRIMARFVLMK